MIKNTGRKQYIEKLLASKDKDLIKVVSGLRRPNKSTLLEMFRSELCQKWQMTLLHFFLMKVIQRK
jgi:predicted AAA+ superfamily ATPase